MALLLRGFGMVFGKVIGIVWLAVSLLVIAACGIAEGDDETAYLPLGEVRLLISAEHHSCTGGIACPGARVVGDPAAEWLVATDTIEGIELVDGTGYLLEVRISGPKADDREGRTAARDARIELLALVEEYADDSRFQSPDS